MTDSGNLLEKVANISHICRRWSRHPANIGRVVYRSYAGRKLVRDAMARNLSEVVQTEDVRVVEYALEPNERHPWHYHSQVSDRFYCLEGLITVNLRTPPNQLVLQPGQSCAVSPNTVHRVSNAGKGVSRYLLVQALGKYDYIRVDEAGGAGDPETSA